MASDFFLCPTPLCRRAPRPLTFEPGSSPDGAAVFFAMSRMNPAPVEPTAPSREQQGAVAQWWGGCSAWRKVLGSICDCTSREWRNRPLPQTLERAAASFLDHTDGAMLISSAPVRQPLCQRSVANVPYSVLVTALEQAALTEKPEPTHWCCILIFGCQWRQVLHQEVQGRGRGRMEVGCNDVGRAEWGCDRPRTGGWDR